MKVSMDHVFTAQIRAHPAVARVLAALQAAGVADSLRVMPSATATAAAAAEALGCHVSEIAKSIVFSAANDRVVLVITSGVNRVDEKKVAAISGEKIGKADADFVLAKTGFVIGGVAPIAHLHAPITLIDEDLMQHQAVFPAAGHPNTMFQIAPRELARITGAKVADIAKRS